jgi:N-acetyl-anhydromuramyl-L-alanine amidase AmpD
MGVYPKLPDERAVRSVEWRARRIRDPIRRLRYLRQAVNLIPPSPYPRIWAHRAGRAAVLILALLVSPAPPSSDANVPLRPEPVLPQVSAATRDETYPKVWPVEKAAVFETHSNGLRIENLFVVANKSRAYGAVPRFAPGDVAWELRTEPVGIVFHTTESHMIAFDPQSNEELKSTGLKLLDYIRRKRSYHFVIDRFGRVHRVVQETDSANHAGWSVWADEEWIYLGLNDSFFGVAFEAQNQPDGDAPTVNPAQVHAGRVLTEMLRAKYQIRQRNCVTHAQVSVNPHNHRIGYHTDWAANLPFRELGLSDNYKQPLPSVYLFAFGYDSSLGDVSDPGLQKGLRAAEEQIRLQAVAREMPVELYRSILQQSYRETITALEREGAWKERYP